MRLGADSEEVYEEMIDRAVAEIDRPPQPLILKLVGWPVTIVGWAIMMVGFSIWNLGRWLTGRSRSDPL